MNDLINKRANIVGIVGKNIPAFLAIVYIFGFIVINSYLGRYGLSSNNLINKDFISAGLLFCFFVLSIVLILLHTIKHPADTKSKSLQESLYYCFFIFLLTIGFTHIFIGVDVITSKFIHLFYIFYYLGLALFVITSILGFKLFWFRLIGTIIFLIYIIIIFTLESKAQGFLFWFLLFSFICWAQYNDSFNNIFSYFKLLWWILGLLLFASLFGIMAFGYIKTEYGGGKPKEIKLIVKKSEKDIHDTIGLKCDSLGISENIYLINETNEYYIIQIDSTFLKLNKDIFQGLIIKKH